MNDKTGPLSAVAVDPLVIWPFLCKCGATATQHSEGKHECVSCCAQRLADESFERVLRERPKTVGV